MVDRNPHSDAGKGAPDDGDGSAPGGGGSAPGGGPGGGDGGGPTGGGGGTGAGPGGSEETSQRRGGGARRMAVTVLRVIAGVIVTIVLLVLLFYLFLQTGPGERVAKGYIENRVNKTLDGAEIFIGELEGNIIGNLTLYDVRLITDEGERLAQVDTLRGSYRLLALLENRFHLYNVYLGQPSVWMEQRPDGSWDLFDVVASDSAAVDTTKERAALIVQLDSLTMSGGRAEVNFNAPPRAPPLRAYEVNLRLSDTEFGEDLRFGVDTLWGAFRTPTHPDEEVRVQAAGELSEDALALRGLRLDSPYSTVRGHGTLALPRSRGAPVRDIDFQLTAAPLAFHDIAPFVPFLEQTGTATIDATVEGTSEELITDADIQFGNGSAAQLDGTIAPGFQGAPSYDVQLSMRQMDLGYILRDQATGTMVINADGSADLAGDDLASLQGTAQFNVFDTRVQEQYIQRATLAGNFDAGHAHVDASADLRGGSINTTGRIGFEDPQPTYAFQGRVSNVQLGELLQNPDQESDLNGSFSLEGQGFDLQTAQLAGRLELANSTLNGRQIQTGVIAFTLRNGTMYVDGTLVTPSGSITVDGVITFGENETRFRVRQGSFENLDISLFTGNPESASRLTGTFTATGSLAPDRPLRVEADISIADGTFAEYQLAGANLNLQLAGDQLTLTGNLGLEEGNLALEGQLNFAGDVVTYRITQGSFENLNIAELTGDPANTSDLTGTFTATGRGTDLASLTLEADVQLQEGRINRQDFAGAQVQLTVQQGQLAFDARLQTADGGLTLTGTSNLLADEVTVAIGEGSFRQLNIGALLNIPELDTRLNGRLYVEDGPIALRTGTFTIVADFDSSAINDAILQDGRLTARFARGHIEAEAALDFAQGSAAFTAAGAFLDTTRLQEGYTLAGRADSLDVTALAGADTLRSHATFTFDLSGRGISPETMQLEGDIAVEDALLDQATISSFRSDFLLNDGMLHVDTLALASSFATLEGSGSVVLFDREAVRTSRLMLEGTVATLDPLRPFLPLEQVAVEEGEFEARVTGTRGQLRFDAAVGASNFVYGDVRVADFTGHAIGQIDSLRSVEDVQVTAETGFLSIPAISVEDTQIEANYTGEALSFATTIRVDRNRDLQMQGRLDFAPEVNRLQVEELQLNLEGDAWQLLQPATIALGDQYRISNFLLYSDDQQVAIDGVIDPNGEQNLVATIENFRIGAVADLFGYNSLGGRVDGSINLTGQAISPDLDGRLMFNLTAEDEAVGEGVATIDYQNQRLLLDAELQSIEGGLLTAEGGLPLDLRLAVPDTLAQQGVRVEAQTGTGAIDLAIEAEAFAVEWILQPFLDPDNIEELGGILTGQATIAGTYEDPQVTGQMQVSDGLVRLASTEVTYRGITGTAQLRESRIVVERAEAHTEDGTLTASGNIHLSELTLGEFNLDVSLSNFMLIDTRDRRVIASGDVDVSGTTEQPIVTGSLDVVSADIYIEGVGAQVEIVGLTDQDQRMLERSFGIRVTEQEARAFDLYQSTALDLDVSLESDAWIRSRSNPEMNIELSGDLNVVKSAFEEAQFFGVIEINEERSYITQFGRRFDLTEGIIRLNGTMAEAIIDAQAELNVPIGGTLGNEVGLVLNVSGRLSNLDLELTSGENSALEGNTVLSTLVFGSPAAANVGLGAVLEQQGALIALSQATTLLEGVAGQELGLDVVEIEYDALLGTTLTAGKYFMFDPLPRPIFAAVRQPIGGELATSVNTGEGTEVTLEYELLQWMLARVAARPSGFRFDIFYEYSY